MKTPQVEKREKKNKPVRFCIEFIEVKKGAKPKEAQFLTSCVRGLLIKSTRIGIFVTTPHGKDKVFFLENRPGNDFLIRFY